MQATALLQTEKKVLDFVPPRPRTVLRDVSRSATTCSVCHLHSRCVTKDLDAQGLAEFDKLATNHIRLPKGATLFRFGDRFTSLYAIRSGSCKTVSQAGDGQEQVAGYHMAGEIIGADGIACASHGCQAVALEDTEVCVLPFERIEALGRQDSRLQRNLHHLLADEITRQRLVMVLLGTMRAEQRLAAFLLDLARRYQARGYSSCEFVLRMTRGEIGSYLGLKLETVSRLFSRFQREGLVQVEGRIVKLLDRLSIQRLVDASD